MNSAHLAGEEAWIGLIGAKDMFNAGMQPIPRDGSVYSILFYCISSSLIVTGGAVLSVDVTPSKVETQLLGSGLYWIALVQPVDGAPISATV